MGFVVGWGLKFHEDAHIGIVTGQGWGVVEPWSAFLPTIELWNTQVYNDHAVRGALEGLSVGAAAMLWHWRRAAWVIGLAGAVIMFWGHVMWNYFVDHSSQAVGGEEAPLLFGALKTLLAGGRVPLTILLAGVVAAVVADVLILRWVGKRDRMFPPLSFGRVLSRLKGANRLSQVGVLARAGSYWRLRRAVYFAAWRTRKSGGCPGFDESDAAALLSTASRFGLLEIPLAKPAPA